MVTEIKDYFQKVSDAIIDCVLMSSTYDEAEKYNKTDIISTRHIEKYIALIEDSIIQNERHAGAAIVGFLPDINGLLTEFKPYSAQMDFAGITGDRDAFVYLQQVNRNFEIFVSRLKETCLAHGIQIPELSESMEYIPEPQQMELPGELNSDEAKRIIDKAIISDIIKVDASGYHWAGTGPQLALFAEIMSEKLQLDKKWKLFETLFGKKHLAQTRQISIERVGKVCGEERITQLFK